MKNDTTETVKNLFKWGEGEINISDYRQDEEMNLWNYDLKIDAQDHGASYDDYQDKYGEEDCPTYIKSGRVSIRSGYDTGALTIAVEKDCKDPDKGISLVTDTTVVLRTYEGDIARTCMSEVYLSVNAARTFLISSLAMLDTIQDRMDLGEKARTKEYWRKEHLAEALGRNPT